MSPLCRVACRLTSLTIKNGDDICHIYDDEGTMTKGCCYPKGSAAPCRTFSSSRSAPTGSGNSRKNSVCVVTGSQLLMRSQSEIMLPPYARARLMCPGCVEFAHVHLWGSLPCSGHLQLQHIRDIDFLEHQRTSIIACNAHTRDTNGSVVLWYGGKVLCGGCPVHDASPALFCQPAI